MPDKLGLMGLARRAGKLVIGAEQCAEAVNAGMACAVFTAEDASPNLKEKAGRLAERGGVPWVCLPYSKERTGTALGRAEAGIMVITDPDFAAGLVLKLREQYPERYDAPYARLASAGKRNKGAIPGKEHLDNIGRKRGRTHR